LTRGGRRAYAGNITCAKVPVFWIRIEKKSLPDHDRALDIDWNLFESFLHNLEWVGVRFSVAYLMFLDSEGLRLYWRLKEWSLYYDMVSPRLRMTKQLSSNMDLSWERIGMMSITELHSWIGI
jgi:hypothetical protein